MAEVGVVFKREDAERIKRAVKAHERQPVNLVGAPRPHRDNRVPAWVHIRAKLVQVGGANATSATTAATWTYDCYWGWDATNAHKLNSSPLSPERPRGLGTYSAATAGSGYFGADGSFVLADAYETPGTEECT